MENRPNPRRWRQIEPIFEAALDLHGIDQERYLDQACAGDPELRREVSELLAAAAAPGILDRRLDELTPALADGASEELDAHSYARGRELGPWRIVEDLGSGGMGRVFVAERTGGDFAQRVALKVLRWEMVDSALAERFLRERQILASLEHPGIARLIDGGVSAEGLPYLATELVEGQDIFAYCDAHALDVPARLKLFLEICDAVDFAHRNLIVHRDLKASNILVDAEGRVKLLDFGVAKIVDEARGDIQTLTGTQLAPATISSAAPEQLNGGAITTATDVWALGVLLYELLCGRKPFARADDTLAQTMRRIAEQDPAPPSEHAAVGRRREVRGDLDNIVRQALRKDATERYGSTAALADDLRRHQSGLPVLAREASWSYRTGKFMRRNARVLSSLAAVFAVIAGLTGYYTARLADERDRATQEARKTQEVKSFVLSMFEVNDPAIAQGEELTARQILDRGSQRIEEELDDQPEIRAEMHETVGILYQALGVYDESDRHFARASELYRASYGSQSEELAKALDSWGFVLGECDRLAEAVPVLRESAAIRRSHQDEKALAMTLNQLGMVLSYRGEYAEAEKLLRESLSTMIRLHGEVHSDVGLAMANLGLTLKWNGDSETAAQLYRRALEIRAQTVGRDHPAYASTLDNLGVLLGQRGDYEESETCFREALEIRKRLLGERHPDVALNLNNLATLFRVQGRLDDAEPIYRQVLELNLETFGPEDRRVGTNLSNLGSLLVARENFDEAIAMFERAAEIRRRSLGDEHIEVALTQGLIVGALVRNGRFAEAEPIARSAIATARAAVEGANPTLAQLLLNFGDVLVAQARAAEAVDVLREARAMHLEVMAPDNWKIAASSVALGRCLAALGQDIEAESLLRDGHDGLVRARGADDWNTGNARRALHEFYARRGRPDDALRYAGTDP